MFPYKQTVHLPKHLPYKFFNFFSTQWEELRYRETLTFPSLLGIPGTAITFPWPYHLDGSVCPWSYLTVLALGWQTSTLPNSYKSPGIKPYIQHPPSSGGLQSSSARSPSSTVLWLSPVLPNLHRQQIPLLRQHWKEEGLEETFKQHQPQDLFLKTSINNFLWTSTSLTGAAPSKASQSREICIGTSWKSWKQSPCLKWLLLGRSFLLV